MWDKFGKFIIAAVFMAFGIYHAFQVHVAEGIFYNSMGIGFAIMHMLKLDMFPHRKDLLNTLSWIFIVLACFSFLYMMTIDFNLI
jgi:hypothetical protein